MFYVFYSWFEGLDLKKNGTGSESKTFKVFMTGTSVNMDVMKLYVFSKKARVFDIFFSIELTS